MRVMLVQDAEIKDCSACHADHPRVTLVGRVFTCMTTRQLVEVLTAVEAPHQ